MTKALVKTQNRLRTFLASREAGQGTLEYVGMLVVAGIFALGLIAAARTAGLPALFSKAIHDITVGG